MTNTAQAGATSAPAAGPTDAVEVALTLETAALTGPAALGALGVISVAAVCAAHIPVLRTLTGAAPLDREDPTTRKETL